MCIRDSHEGVPMISDVNRVHKDVVTVEPKEAWYITALRLLVTAFLVMMSGLFSGLNLGLMGPVSYTHLDVYKRQGFY